MASRPARGCGARPSASPRRATSTIAARVVGMTTTRGRSRVCRSITGERDRDRNQRQRHSSSQSSPSRQPRRPPHPRRRGRCDSPARVAQPWRRRASWAARAPAGLGRRRSDLLGLWLAAGSGTRAISSGTSSPRARPRVHRAGRPGRSRSPGHSSGVSHREGPFAGFAHRPERGGRLVNSSNCSAAWCTSRSRPDTRDRSEARTDAANGVGQGS